ncbi:hypothetical protein [Nostoc sp.]|uniref:hypothetical protein n=1 Tax=Nostoc sp. TaxID=1180 RepID=UPI002FF8F92A
MPQALRCAIVNSIIQNWLTGKKILLPTVGDRVNNSATLEIISSVGWAAMTFDF